MMHHRDALARPGGGSRRRTPWLAAAAATALLLAGCSSGPPEAAVAAEALACPSGSDCYDPVRAVGPGGAMTVAGGEFFFEIQEATLVQGEIEVTLDNVGGTLHNIVFVGDTLNDGPVVEVNAGETGTGTAGLFPGPVTFYCSVPGHRPQGMEGTATVYATEEEAAAAATESPTAAPSS